MVTPEFQIAGKKTTPPEASRISCREAEVKTLAVTETPLNGSSKGVYQHKAVRMSRWPVALAVTWTEAIAPVALLLFATELSVLRWNRRTTGVADLVGIDAELAGKAGVVDQRGKSLEPQLALAQDRRGRAAGESFKVLSRPYKLTVSELRANPRHADFMSHRSDGSEKAIHLYRSIS